MRKVEKRERKKHDRGIVDFMMITSLILIKQFNRIRLQGNYWCVILDDTGLFYFKKRHCENCLVTTKWTEDGKTIQSFQSVCKEMFCIQQNR